MHKKTPKQAKKKRKRENIDKKRTEAKNHIQDILTYWLDVDSTVWHFWDQH